MKVSVYKTFKYENFFLYVSEAEGLTRVPQSLLCKFADRCLVLNFDLTIDVTLAKEDPEKVLDNINRVGYHLQLPPVFEHQ